MPEYRKANVYVQNIYAGLLSETDEGYTFQYDRNYVKRNCPAASLTLPLQIDSFSSNVLFPFFDGLIPEGWLLDVDIAAAMGVKTVPHGLIKTGDSYAYI